MKNNSKAILDVQDLTVSFSQYDKGTNRIELEVIHNLNVNVNPGEVVAVVGSSGSGKSLLAHAVLGLLPYNCNVSGYIYYNGVLMDSKKIEEERGKGIVLVPQSVNYLDPLEKVGKQVRKNSKDKNDIQRQRELFKYYSLKENTEDLYPFELSGGMARRVLLASSMMERPRLVIADEPTPGLHLEAAKKAMEHFRNFANEGNGVLLITHDIELSLEIADRIAVFYAGTTLEEALVSDFGDIEKLRHPYTKALWKAMPQNGFEPSLGTQPYAKDEIKGCPYGPRCELFSKECEIEIPVSTLRDGTVRCIKAK